MREAAFAEFALSLVIAPNRAATTVGDLLEEPQTRGRVWFWRSVLGTAATCLLRDLMEDPFRTVCLMVWALVAELVGLFATGLGVMSVAWKLHISSMFFELGLDFIIGLGAVPWSIGWSVAKSSRGHEAAAGLAAAVAIFYAIHRFFGAGALFVQSVAALLTLAGATLCRFSKLSR